MSNQPEALALADWLDTSSYGPLDNRHKAAAMLRTQHAAIERKDALLRQALEALSFAQSAVADWGGYASKYFQDKHDLKNDIEALSPAIAAITKELQ